MADCQLAFGLTGNKYGWDFGFYYSIRSIQKTANGAASGSTRFIRIYSSTFLSKPANFCYVINGMVIKKRSSKSKHGIGEALSHKND
jgi:hypothetical protein